MSYLEISINKIGNHHLIFWFPNEAKYYDRKENLYDINSISMLAVEHVVSLKIRQSKINSRWVAGPIGQTNRRPSV